MPDHSPEPWSTRNFEIEGSDGPLEAFAFVDRDGNDVFLEYPENRERVLACVNALTGIDNPEEWVRRAKVAVDVFGEGLEEFADGQQD